MNRTGLLPLVARSLAAVIALLAILDPAVERNRFDAAVVSVIAGPRSVDSVAAAAVRDRLKGSVRVVDTPFDGADAQVFVGRSLQPALLDRQIPSIVVTPDRSITARAARFSPTAPSTARAELSLRVEGLPPGNAASVTLREGGIAIDRVDVAGNPDSSATAIVSAAAARTGVRRLRLELTARSESIPLQDLASVAREDRHRVLFWESRPTWGGTFVRRSLEADPSMTVSGRSVTSRAISTEVGRPPRTLEQLDALRVYDAIVVSGTEALTASELRGLDQFLRMHGGSVVLLLDAAPSAALATFCAVPGGWQHRGVARALPVHVLGSESSQLTTASDFVWPSVLPEGSEVLAEVRVAATTRTPEQRIPALWSIPVGAGSLYVAGATDSWKTRTVEGTRFSAFWQGAVASAAARAVPPLRVTVRPSVVRPGARVVVQVEDRESLVRPSPSGARSMSALWHDSSGTRQGAIALRPAAERGVSLGGIDAPLEPGSYIVRADGGGVVDSAAVVVSGDAIVAGGDDHALLARWAASSGGSVVPLEELGRVQQALSPLLQGKVQRGESHPMRSGWWIVPFALLLGFEWWSRRRAGLS